MGAPDELLLAELLLDELLLDAPPPDELLLEDEVLPLDELPDEPLLLDELLLTTPSPPLPLESPPSPPTPSFPSNSVFEPVAQAPTNPRINAAKPSFLAFTSASAHVDVGGKSSRGSSKNEKLSCNSSASFDLTERARDDGRIAVNQGW